MTRIRQRWGVEHFRKIFKRTVEACLEAKIATAEIVHVDTSLIRANVSWESLVERHMDEVEAEDAAVCDAEDEENERPSCKYKKVSVTDPDVAGR